MAAGMAAKAKKLGCNGFRILKIDSLLARVKKRD